MNTKRSVQADWVYITEEASMSTCQADARTDDVRVSGSQSVKGYTESRVTQGQEPHRVKSQCRDGKSGESRARRGVRGKTGSPGQVWESGVTRGVQVIRGVRGQVWGVQGKAGSPGQDGESAASNNHSCAGINCHRGTGLFLRHWPHLLHLAFSSAGLCKGLFVYLIQDLVQLHVKASRHYDLSICYRQHN